MITGREMNGLYASMMQEMVAALQNECENHGDINQAAKDSIYEENVGGVYVYMYDLYDPVIYNRRYANQGLGDENNLETVSVTSTANSVTVLFNERTRENGSGVINPDPAFYVSDIVESGTYGPKWRSWLQENQVGRPYLEYSLQDGTRTGAVIDRAIEDTVRNLRINW